MTTMSRRTVIASAAALGASALAGRAGAQAGRYPVFGKIERLDPALDALIPRDAVVEQVMDGFNWSEGPCWVGGRDGMLLVSDVRDDTIRSWSEKAGKADWLHPSGFADGQTAEIYEPGTNGLIVARGGIVACDSGNRNVAAIDLRTKQRRVLADRFEGKRLNSPNDLCISPTTKVIYFTDPPYGLRNNVTSPLRELDFTGVFALAPDNTLSLVGKYAMPNGIAISPDGRTLFHTDAQRGWIAHDLDRSGKPVSERVFIARDVMRGGDGMEIDAAGNFWMSTRDGIAVLDRTGKKLGLIRGDDVMSNCEIAADGYVYISTNHRVTRVKVTAKRPRIA
jgi:gluconolactonase